jgi:hypothetical protein
MRISVTNDEGEVYSILDAAKDDRGRWWFTDEDGDVLSGPELFDAAEIWENLNSKERTS